MLILLLSSILSVGIVNGQASPLTSAKFDVNIKGVLKCAEYPAATVRVRLWKNNEKAVLDETYVDKSGNFELSASTSEREFNPIVVIYHDCNDGVKPGQRKLKFQVPKHYITFGEANKRVFNLGSFNLETVMKYNEERQDYVDKRRRRTIHKSPRVDDLEKLEEDEIRKQKQNRSKNHHHHSRRAICSKCGIKGNHPHHEKYSTKNVFNGRDEEIDERNSEW